MTVPSGYNQHYSQGGPPATPTNGMATAGLLLGIASIFINTLLLPSILAIVFSSIGIKKYGEILRTSGYRMGQGAAVTGLVCGILGLVNSLLWKWLFFFLF